MEEWKSAICDGVHAVIQARPAGVESMDVMNYIIRLCEGSEHAGEPQLLTEAEWRGRKRL